jgi:tetratricopeptide (TPR) repeat protein
MSLSLTSSQPARRADELESFLLFAVFGGVILFVALNGGGFDIVFRGQLGLGLLWGAGLLLAFGALPAARLGGSARALCVVLLGLVVWTAASLVWTESVERSYGDVSRVVTYAGAMGVILLAVSRRNWKSAAFGLCAAAILVPVLAVIDRLAPELLGTYALSGFERLSYPFGYWNALAAWTSMALVISLALSSHLRSRAMRGLCLGVVPALGLAGYLTLSRGGVLASAVGIVVFLALSHNRFVGVVHVALGGAGVAAMILAIRSYPELETASGNAGAGEVALLSIAVCVACGWAGSMTRRLKPPPILGGGKGSLALAFVVAGGVAAAAFSFGSEGLTGAREQFQSGRYPSQDGDPAARLATLEGGRSEIWESAFRAFESEPLTGIGAGAFELWWTRDVVGAEELREPHSLLFGQLAELGLVGAVLMLMLLSLLTIGAVRAARNAQGSSASALSVALCAAWVAFAVQAQIDWLWESTAVALLALGCAGVLVAARDEPRSSRSRRKAARIRYALASLAIAAGVAIVPGIVATERVRASFSQLAIGDPSEAFETADEAVSSAPWLASTYATRALVELRSMDFDAARTDALDAIDREPTDWRHRVLLAVVEEAAGNQPASEAALDEAMSLNPDLNVESDAIGDTAAGDR